MKSIEGVSIFFNYKEQEPQPRWTEEFLQDYGMFNFYKLEGDYADLYEVHLIVIVKPGQTIRDKVIRLAIHNVED